MHKTWWDSPVHRQPLSRRHRLRFHHVDDHGSHCSPPLLPTGLQEAARRRIKLYDLHQCRSSPPGPAESSAPPAAQRSSIRARLIHQSNDTFHMHNLVDLTVEEEVVASPTLWRQRGLNLVSTRLKGSKGPTRCRASAPMVKPECVGFYCHSTGHDRINVIALLLHCNNTLRTLFGHFIFELEWKWTERKTTNSLLSSALKLSLSNQQETPAAPADQV